MYQVPMEIQRGFTQQLQQNSIPEKYHPHYHRWLRYYLDFCYRYKMQLSQEDTLSSFLKKLEEKEKELWQRKQAHHAVQIYQKQIHPRDRFIEKQSSPNSHESGTQVQETRSKGLPASRPKQQGMQRRHVSIKPPQPPQQKQSLHTQLDKHTQIDITQKQTSSLRPSPPQQRNLSQKQTPSLRQRQRNSPQNHSHETTQPRGRTNSDHIPLKTQGEINRPQPSEKKLTPSQPTEPHKQMTWEEVYSALETIIQVKHYSPKTLKTYKSWTSQFATFTKKPPEEVHQQDVVHFLNHLAIKRQVSASSQNLAFNALLFLFKNILQKDFGSLHGVMRAKRTKNVPSVLSREEIQSIFTLLEHPFELIAKLLYGCGLRLSECLSLRVQDLDFENQQLTVHNGKGKKDRIVPLPHSILHELRKQMDRVISVFQQDLVEGFSGVFLPHQLEKKYKNCGKELIWQWFFPAENLTTVESGEKKRYHVHETSVQKVIKKAALVARIPKRVSPHILRHSFASHLLQANFDIRTIQQLLGHNDVRTTMIYTHTAKLSTKTEAQSPLDIQWTSNKKNSHKNERSKQKA